MKSSRLTLTGKLYRWDLTSNTLSEAIMPSGRKRRSKLRLYPKKRTAREPCGLRAVRWTGWD